MKAQNKKIVYINNVNETMKFAKDLAKSARKNDIFCLNGNLGAGKTVIAKSIGKFFNVSDDIVSPTFNIVKVYDTNNKTIKKINHFDLYRLKSISDLVNIGFEEYIYDDNAITLIEWPMIAKDIIPDSAKWICIEKDKDNEYKRKITYDF